MARHNRDGSGADQLGFGYEVNYQPDWLRHVKVTRVLESGRQSTKDPVPQPRRPSGGVARRAHPDPDRLAPTRGLDFEVAVTDLKGSVARVRVAFMVTNAKGEKEEVEFTLENELPPPIGG
jgi:hypothetical protein